MNEQVALLTQIRDAELIGSWEELKRGIARKRTLVREAHFKGQDNCVLVVRGHEGGKGLWVLANFNEPNRILRMGIFETNFDVEVAKPLAEQALAALNPEDPQTYTQEVTDLDVRFAFKFDLAHDEEAFEIMRGQTCC